MLYANIIDIWEQIDELADTVDDCKERYEKLTQFLYDIPIYEPGMICTTDEPSYYE